MTLSEDENVPDNSRSRSVEEYSKQNCNTELSEEQEPLSNERKIESENSEAQDSIDKKKSIIQRIKHDKDYRGKLIVTVFLWWSFASLGWAAAQTGPTFLDLQIITNSSLDKASAFMTGGAVGYLVGSLIAGFLLRKVNSQCLLAIACTGFGAVTVVVPWCSVYEIMILAMFIRSIFIGIQDTVGNTELLRTWGSENKSYMQALHFFFAFGGIISPLATAPFLSPTPDIEFTNSTSLIRHNFSFTSMNNFETNQTQRVYLTLNSSIRFEQNLNIESSNKTDYVYNISEIGTAENVTNYSAPGSTKSRFYIAYLITAVLYFSAAFLFVISFFKSKNQKKYTENGPDKKSANRDRKLPLPAKVIVLINVCILITLYCAAEESFASFLTTFVVKQLNWTKPSGAYATSMFWTSFCAGRFLGIFLIKCIKPFIMIICCFILLHIVYIGIILSSLWLFEAGIWIFVTIAGLSMSVIFPTIFSWTEDQLFSVSGAVASFFMVSASVGAMVNPIILGYFMDNVTPMFFCYLPLGECVAFICFLFMAFYLSRKIKRYHKRKTLEIEIDMN